MHHQDSWSVGVGRWMGAPIRLHVSLLLALILIFAVEWNFLHLPTQMGGIPAGTALATAVALLAAVLLHELAHLFLAFNLGGTARKIVFTPWGGQSELLLPSSPRVRIAVYTAGICANAMMFLLTATVLIQLGHANLAQLTNPLAPHALSGITEVAVLKIFCWINFQLTIFNLLPAFPFDGSQILRQIIWANNRQISRHRLETSVMAVAHMIAVAFLVLAVFAKDVTQGPIQPIWGVLAATGLLLMFASRFDYFRRTAYPDSQSATPRKLQEEEIDFEAVYDDDGDPYDPESDSNETMSQWLREKLEERQLVEYEIEKEDEERADAILQKLHQCGKESLTDDERAVLQRVSDRYRRRRRQLPS